MPAAPLAAASCRALALNFAWPRLGVDAPATIAADRRRRRQEDNKRRNTQILDLFISKYRLGNRCNRDAESPSGSL